ncbi:ABC transporter ATP-binding protein [Isachenkonia alkalipeptolytica]|uniref:ABC transporter ATP-binding protein n=2 Tax=Isachenkonia alkalipeptolytica TaxID=2565777 RepID=A0AA43XHZ5_9CLOT|nr:ABC transporter ATP-binding protein [Isachenkonia alkalipeptolytica]
MDQDIKKEKNKRRENKDPVLELSNVKKTIRKKGIIKGIDLSVYAGEVFGFLGPNGAGKTTTLRMIVGLIRMTEGEIKIGGYSVKKDFVKAMENVGCIIENPEMYDYLSGWENLKVLASMERGITKDRIKEMVSLVGLEKRIDDKVYTYSLGMKQRLGIAQALMKRPKLLILDEPTNGLDPSGISEFRHLIRSLAEKENLGVLVSSHILGEMEMLTDRVAIIRQGSIVKVTSVDEIIKEKGITYRLADPLKAKSLIETEFNGQVQIRDDEELVAFVKEEDVPAINQRLFSKGIPLYYVAKNQKSLEDLFLELTAGDEIV